MDASRLYKVKNRNLSNLQRCVLFVCVDSHDASHVFGPAVVSLSWWKLNILCKYFLFKLMVRRSPRSYDDLPKSTRSRQNDVPIPQ